MKGLHTLLDHHTVFEIKGNGDSGKSYVLNTVLESSNTSAHWIACSPALDFTELEDTLLQWVNGHLGPNLVLDHYDVMPDGFWTQLIPNSNHQIFIQGHWHSIPQSFHCILIHSAHHNTHSQRFRSIDTYLPFILKTIPLSTSSGWPNACSTPTRRKVGLNVYNTFNIKLGIQHYLGFTGTKGGFMDTSTRAATERAKANALYLLASLHFHSSNLWHLSDWLPIHSAD